MNKYLSHKLKIMSFILVTLVIVLHSYKVKIKFNAGNLDFNSGYNFLIQLFFSEGIARIAVPLFFGISGYLFFLKLNGTLHEFILKYQKRVRTLLLPYLLWSAWGLLFYLMLQSFPQSRSFFTNERIADYSFTEFLHTLILNPIPYQLWFLRDLILLVLLSPLIYWLIRYFKIVPLLLLFMIWFGFVEFSFVIFRTESIFFFITGAYLAIHKHNLLLKRLDQTGYLAFTFVWILTVALKTVLIFQRPDQTALILLSGKLSILSGIIALWSLYDRFMKNNAGPNTTLLNLSSFSFFIYGFHEPTLTLIQKGLFYITGSAEIMTTINYILAPAITLTIAIALAYALKRVMPSVYGLMTGGR